jgi:hypothetical protein
MSALSFKGVRPEQLHVRIPVCSCSHHHPEVFAFFFSLSLTHSMGAGASTLPALALSSVSFLFWKGSTPPQGQILDFPKLLDIV